MSSVYHHCALRKKADPPHVLSWQVREKDPDGSGATGKCELRKLAAAEAFVAWDKPLRRLWTTERVCGCLAMDNVGCDVGLVGQRQPEGLNELVEKCPCGELTAIVLTNGDRHSISRNIEVEHRSDRRPSGDGLVELLGCSIEPIAHVTGEFIGKRDLGQGQIQSIKRG